MTKPLIKNNSKNELAQRCILLFRQLSTQLKKLNITIPAFNENEPYLFMNLQEEQINNLSHSLQQTIENLELSIEKTKDQENLNLSQLWTFLADNKLNYPPDLFDYITKGDILEVYNNENKQIFRSYNFFCHCTYTLDELFSTPWPELYYRDPIYILEYMRLLSNLIEKNSKEILKVTTVPPHWVSQLKTHRKTSHYIQTKIICLVYDAQNKIRGYIHTQRILDPVN